jgi:hypothetical protein
VFRSVRKVECINDIWKPGLEKETIARCVTRCSWRSGLPADRSGDENWPTGKALDIRRVDLVER